MPEGEGAEAWKVFSEHYEPKTATRYVGMLRQILLYDFGELTQLIDRMKYEEQSGESMTDNVRQAVFQAGIKDAAIRDHLALHSIRWLLRYRPLPGPAARMMLCQWMSLCSRARAEKARGRRRPKMTGTSLIPSRDPTSSRSVSTVTRLDTSGLIAERRNVMMRNAETCRHRTV